MNRPTQDISALSPLAESIAAIAMRLISKSKPGVSDILGLVLADGGVIKDAISSIKEVPAEFLDIDAEEGQALSALVKQKMGPAADHTQIDEIIGEVFLLVPKVRTNWEIIKEDPSFENKGIAIGALSTAAGRLVDLVHPPKLQPISEPSSIAG